MSPAQIVKEWWAGTYARKVTVIAVAISSTIAALLAVMHLGQVAEPYWFATRDFTRELVKMAEDRARQRDTTTGIRIISVEIAVKEGERRNIQAQIDRINVELTKIPAIPDNLRDILSEQFRRYSDQIRSLNYEIDDLRRQQAERR
jgi:hypothetical protein